MTFIYEVDGDTVRLQVPGDLFTENRQRRMHWREEAHRKAVWRAAAKYAAKMSGAEPMEHARIVIRPQQAKGRLADPQAYAPCSKACVDGIVDARLLPDDSPKYVESIVHYPPVRSDYDALVIEIVRMASP